MILFHTEIPGREKAGVKLFLELAFASVLIFRALIFLVLTLHRNANVTNLTEGGWYAV